MFAELLRRLTAPDHPEVTPDEARLSLAAILVRVARSDGNYAPEEKAQIDHLIATRYGLSPPQAAKLRADAEVLESEAPDTVRFTRAIKEAVPYEERIGVIESLWRVVLADGKRDEEEDALIRMVAPMLGVNDRESNLARIRVRDGA